MILTTTTSTLPAIGSRIHYTGDMANSSGNGYMLNASGDVGLDDGRYFARLFAAHFDRAPGCRFLVVGGEACTDPAELIRRQRAETERRAIQDARILAQRTEEAEAVTRGTEIAARLIPADCKALIVAYLREDNSDLMSDYHNSKTMRTVILAVSSHTRSLFPEMRKAAMRLDATAHLATDKGTEHRENYSMGAGTYLSDSEFRHDTGWQIRKETVRNGRFDSDILRALGKGDHTL